MLRDVLVFATTHTYRCSQVNIWCSLTGFLMQLLLQYNNNYQNYCTMATRMLDMLIRLMVTNHSLVIKPTIIAKIAKCKVLNIITLRMAIKTMITTMDREIIVEPPTIISLETRILIKEGISTTQKTKSGKC